MAATILAILITLLPVQAKPEIRAADLERKVYTLVNEQRRAHNLPTIASDSGLADVARAHSADMVRRGFFDHVNPDGRDPRRRVETAGHPCRAVVSENIYEAIQYSRIVITNGQKAYDWKTLDQIASEIVDGWMASAGHRANILGTGYATTGVGIAVSSNDEVYATQVFCG
jgi:uncharacterized protein YkwD